MMRSDRIVYHNNGGQDDGSTNVDEYLTYPNSLTGSQLTKYVLMRLVDNHSVEKISKDFDNDVRFINGVVDFLKDIRWIKQDPGL